MAYMCSVGLTLSYGNDIIVGADHSTRDLLEHLSSAGIGGIANVCIVTIVPTPPIYVRSMPNYQTTHFISSQMVSHPPHSIWANAAEFIEDHVSLTLRLEAFATERDRN